AGPATGGAGGQGGGLGGVGHPARPSGQQGEAEGEGLAGTGPAAAEYVAAGQGVRQGRRLDRERHGHALMAERGRELRGHVEIGERFDGGQPRRDRLRRRELPLEGASGRPVALALRTALTAAGATRSGAAAETGVGAGRTSALHAKQNPSLMRRAPRNSRSRRTAQRISRRAEFDGGGQADRE